MFPDFSGSGGKVRPARFSPILRKGAEQGGIFLGIWCKSQLGYKIAVASSRIIRKTSRNEIDMIRHLVTCLAVAGLFSFFTAVSAAAESPIYEIMINGESFLIRTNRAQKLESKLNPGVTYNVALRIAPTQQHKMNQVRFDYDWLCEIVDNRKPRQRTVRMTHELGFTMLITELGGVMEPETQAEVLKAQSTSVVEALGEMKVKELKVGKPLSSKSEGNNTQRVVIRYNDEEGDAHTCVVCVLVKSDFAVSIVVEYLDAGSKDVLPLIKKTLGSLDSIR